MGGVPLKLIYMLKRFNFINVGQHLLSYSLNFINVGQCPLSYSNTGHGGNPKWNEKLTLKAEYPGSGGDYRLYLRIMDKDTFSSDDFLGQTM